MAHSTRKNAKKSGKYITRNQQRKLDYARLAAQAAKKGGGDVVNLASRGRVLKKTNHKKGFSQAENDRKHEEAIFRNDGWASLSPLEQIGELDKRLGPGIGAVKQRAKILARINSKHGISLNLNGLAFITQSSQSETILKVKLVRKNRQAQKEAHDRNRAAFKMNKEL